MEKKIKYIICLLLFIAPIILMGRNYIVGGDDMKLYYLFPKEYLENFTFNLISENTLAGAITGYGTVSYFAPFFAFILLLKTILPFLNTQAVMYGLNFSLGFFFFYKFLQLYIPNLKKIWKLEIVLIIASVSYVFSPFLNETLLSHQMMHLYLISIVPAVFYYLIRAIREGEIRYALISVLIFSIFSTTLNSMPYFAAYVICLLPLLFYEIVHSGKKSFLPVIISGISCILLNFYWIFFFILGIIHNTGLSEAFSGTSFENENIRIATGVSTLFSPLNQIFQTMIPGTYHISLLIFFNILYITLIVVAGYLVKKAEKKTYYLVLLCFLVSWFFFSPNFGSWGPNLFVWLTKNIPAWGMFRNMYDKFAPAFAFTYALAFGYGLSLIIPKLNRRFTIVLLTIFTFVTLLHLPNILNPFAKDRDGLSKITGDFNPDFWNLVSYFKTNDNQSRVLWLPLNAPTYVAIEDSNTGNYYTGLSPFRVLAGRSDLTGKYSFLTQHDIFLGDKVFDDLKNGNYDKVGTVLQELNVGFIIVDHQKVPRNLEEYYYGGVGLPLLNYQDASFRSEILGDKLADFGSRYSVYEINPRYASNHISLENDKAGGIHYSKINSEEYSIDVTHLSTDTQLQFFDAYNKEWNLQIGDIDYAKSQNTVLNDYANSWHLNKSEIEQKYPKNITKNTDGSINFQLHLFFSPKRYNTFVYGVSTLALATILLYLCIPKRIFKR